MTNGVKEALHIYSAIGKGRFCFTRCLCKSTREFRQLIYHPHAPATAAGARLQKHGETNFLGYFESGLDIQIGPI